MASDRQPSPPSVSGLVSHPTPPTLEDFTAVWGLLPGVQVVRALLWFPIVVTSLAGVASAIDGVRDFAASAFSVLLWIVAARLLFEGTRYVWARIRVEALGSAPTYALDEKQLLITARRGDVPRLWSTLRSYRETSDALVLFGRAGGVLVLPKRAFDFDRAGLRGFLRRHLDESSSGTPASRAAFVTLGIVLFLVAWHFLTTEDPPRARPLHPDAASD